MKFLAVYASLSQVQRIKQRFAARGMYVDMVRAPQYLAVRGCAFALRCDAELLEEVRRVSAELSIAIGGIFEDPTESS